MNIFWRRGKRIKHLFSERGGATTSVALTRLSGLALRSALLSPPLQAGCSDPSFEISLSPS